MTLSFHHGGRYGDLLYALWTVRKVCEDKGCKAVLKISDYHTGWNYGEIEKLRSFLDHQSYIKRVEHYPLPDIFYSRSLTSREFVDYDLHAPERVHNPNDFPLWDPKSGWPGNVHLGERTAKYFGFEFDHDSQWLEAEEGGQALDMVFHYPERRATRPLSEVVGIVQRVSDAGYSIGILGSKEDIEWMPPQQRKKQIYWTNTPTFLELAGFIKNAGVFYGVASAPFVLAAGLKVPRLVDLQPHCRNNLPLGSGGVDSTNWSVDNVVGSICSLLDDARARRQSGNQRPEPEA